MATEELVTEQFQFLGIEIEDHVLKRCVSLCEEYNIDAETFVEQWMAFSLSQLEGASPNIEHLNLLERKEFSKLSADHVSAPAARAAVSLPVYGSANVKQSAHDDDDDNVMSTYLMTSPKRVKVEPDIPVTQGELRPVTYSPSIERSAKYTARTNSGSVLHSYGEESLLTALAEPNDISNVLEMNVEQVPNQDGEIYKKAMFGFELLQEKASVHDSHINYLVQCIMKKANITETVSVRHKTQNEVFVGGRVECDAEARLNPKSVVLQGTWEHSLSLAVPLDLDQVKQYSVFPGQVVVARGVNPRGDRFLAHEVYTDAASPPPTHTLAGSLSIVAASGPYTTSDNLSYEPLRDLVQYLAVNKPHLVILTGPFLDADHELLKNNTLAETYRAFFDKLLDNVAEITNLSPLTKVYVVSNVRDLFHVNIYPTPPYTSRRKHHNVHFLPDPSTITVNGLMIGVTSTDVLMHLSQEEISLGMGGDKLSRLSSHVTGQQCYYPLWPPPSRLPVDAALWSSHGHLPATPHLLLLPSNFRYFVKELKDCVVVNPEHLTKGTGGGTFARILVKPTPDTLDLTKCIAAQILRI